MSLRTYLAAEDGAVTVDWVVLTAALVGLSLAVVGVLSDSFRQSSTTLQNYLSRDDLMCSDFCDRFGDASGGEVENGEAKEEEVYP